MLEAGETNFRDRPLYDQGRMEKAVKVLERHRYYISPEFQELYRKIDEEFWKIREEYDCLAGLSFWGSGIKGVQKESVFGQDENGNSVFLGSDSDLIFLVNDTPDNIEEILAEATERFQRISDLPVQTKRRKGHFKFNISRENLDRKFENLINKIDTMAAERGVEVVEFQNDATRWEGEDDKSYFG